MKQNVSMKPEIKMAKLLTTNNYKTLKGEGLGYKTFILQLAPALSSGFQVCPKASVGCTLACLNTAGMAKFPAVQKARINKTKFFFSEREAFMTQLVKEIKSAIKSAKKLGLIPIFRLNGTSDIAWEKLRVVNDGIEYRNLMLAFPEITFYDYTAIPNRTVPDNYHLTFSRKESNDTDVQKAIDKGYNVAVVFDKLPETYLGLRVFAGDESDVRINDPKGVIVGLLAKGRAKKDISGFVVKVA